jgi:hypothetical protein
LRACNHFHSCGKNARHAPPPWLCPAYAVVAWELFLILVWILPICNQRLECKQRSHVVLICTPRSREKKSSLSAVASESRQRMMSSGCNMLDYSYFILHTMRAFYNISLFCFVFRQLTAMCHARHQQCSIALFINTKLGFHANIQGNIWAIFFLIISTTHSWLTLLNLCFESRIHAVSGVNVARHECLQICIKVYNAVKKK